MLVLKKRLWIITLALAAIASMVLYLNCADRCSYLQGSLFGIDLKYVGIIFMVIIIVLALSKLDELLSALLAVGLGAEIYLLCYQIEKGVYCPYCLAFASCLLFAFLLSYRRPACDGSFLERMIYIFGDVRIRGARSVVRFPLVFFIVIGVAVMPLAFSGADFPSYAQADSLPKYMGTGKTEVRVYTDYLCAPCNKVEPEMEKILLRAIKAGKVRVLFVDTPIHPETVFYARYFQYVALTENDPDKIFAARKILFNAGTNGIRDTSTLERQFTRAAISFSRQDTSTVFGIFSNLLREDHIDTTPSLVIISASGKKKYVGLNEVQQALNSIQ